MIGRISLLASHPFSDIAAHASQLECLLDRFDSWFSFYLIITIIISLILIKISNFSFKEEFNLISSKIKLYSSVASENLLPRLWNIFYFSLKQFMVKLVYQNCKGYRLTFVNYKYQGDMTQFENNVILSHKRVKKFISINHRSRRHSR